MLESNHAIRANSSSGYRSLRSAEPSTIYGRSVLHVLADALDGPDAAMRIGIVSEYLLGDVRSSGRFAQSCSGSSIYTLPTKRNQKTGPCMKHIG